MVLNYLSKIYPLINLAEIPHVFLNFVPRLANSAHCRLEDEESSASHFFA